MIAGIAGGLAKYLNIDPVLVRLGIVVLTFAGGTGILAYVIAWVVIPEEPYPSEGDWTETPAARPARQSTAARMIVGIVLVVIGIGMLAKLMIPALAGIFWPLIVVAAGAALIFHGSTR